MNCNELLVQLLLASVVGYGCDALLCLNVKWTWCDANVVKMIAYDVSSQHVKWLVLAVSYDRAVSDDALLIIVICNEKKVWSTT